MRFPTILLCCLAILLCAAPTLHAQKTVPAGETWDIDYEVKEFFLYVDGIANLLTGASAQYIYVQGGGTLNMYSGTIGEGCFIVSSGTAGITIYGTEFEVSNGTIEFDGYWNPNGIGTLTGYYGDTSPINLMFYSDKPIHLQPPPPEEIQIDIKPGSDLNNINLKSRGVVPVAVLTTDDFDAGTIEPDTVTFAGAAPVRWKLEDVDDDGDVDMLFHFRTHDLKLDESITKAAGAAESTETTLRLRLTGNRTDGEVIQGTDEVRIVVPGKK